MPTHFEPGDVFEHEGRALRIWRIEEAGPPLTTRLLCGIEDSDASIAEAEEEFRIWVSPQAAARIMSKGGRLFLWEKAIGNAWLQDKATFTCPDEVAVGFQEFDTEGVQVLIASDIELPERLTIDCAPFPLQLKLRILWDREPWGQRGPGTKFMEGHA